MKQLSLTLLLLLVAGVLLYVYTTQRQVNMSTEAVTHESAPEGNPGMVIPEGALVSCEEKTVGDGCYFIIQEEKRDGICQDIMGTLTCGPTFPDGTY